MIQNFCCCVSDLYHDEPEKSDTRMRGDLHSRVNQRRSKDRMNEGMFGSHVSRSVYTTNTEDIAKQRGLQLCIILHDVISIFILLFSGLMLDPSDLDKLDALEYMKQLEIVVGMPVNLDVKRKLREKLHEQDPDFKGNSCRAMCYQCKVVSAVFTKCIHSNTNEIKE